MSSSFPKPPILVSLPVGVIFQSAPPQDRKSTRLNSSHQIISYAVFCLKKKNTTLHSPHERLWSGAICLKQQKRPLHTRRQLRHHALILLAQQHGLIRQQPQRRTERSTL